MSLADTDRQDHFIDLQPQSANDASHAAGDIHTRDRWRWLDQVLADRELTSFAFTVAYAIAAHLNRETGEAFPSQARMAEMVGSTDRGVRKIVEQLASRGHLVIHAPTGRKGGNRYRLILKTGAEVIEFHRNGCSYESELDRNDGSGNEEVHRNGGSGETKVHRNGGSGKNAFHRNGGSGLTGTVVPPNPLNEPLERKTLSSSSLPKTKPRTAKPQADDTSFDELWRLYPRKVGLDAARKAYAAAIGRGKLHSDIVNGAKRYSASRIGQDPKFTAHLSTWLNGGRWTDEEQPSSHGPAPAARTTFEVRGVPIPEEKIQAVVQRWRAGGAWHAPWGPPPDHPGCRIPQRFLEQEIGR